MKQLRRRVRQSWSRLRKQSIMAFTRLRGSIERYQRVLTLVAVGIGLVLVGLLGLVLWRRSPAFRAALVTALGAAAAAIATARAVRPVTEPISIPNPAAEAAEAVLEIA